MRIQCSRCKIRKSEDMFFRRAVAKNGRENICKKCRMKDKKKWDANHREHLDKFRREYRRSPKAKFVEYKCSAKSRKLPFTLTFDEFMKFWEQQCRYCGQRVDKIGIDRVDNSKGYTLDNSVSCCTWCNKMKLNHSEEEFFEHIKLIHSRIDTKDVIIL